ncbi:biotin/lipoyl-containing protein [Tamlana crocina]|uniref:Acetyl-CoA carboxylase biotin carboxyl carrier protein subunit n=1 Tax=Tamlana crocina TaxID=393006 RepID=A0ABX1DE86_9FLAO|nr:biotin/lipoyl-containing protein [Tamlana crocina]NJX16650.1 acetyl-CoA carboxylase biotin carboxyl carrier protein subunit [Tamlana crocina]
MSKNFKATVNSAFHFNISESDVSNLDALETSKTSYHILHQNKPYEAKIVSSHFNGKSYRIRINNNNYHVQINDDLDVMIKDMGFTARASKLVDVIKAPMPGLILEIQVDVGQTVKENDPLLILEAMKMENSMVSPRDGVIKSIVIKPGDAVDKNQLLIEFEA